MVLTNSYQYLGRSEVMKSKSGSISYYILLYGKTSANQSTGIHTVTIKEVLASTNNGATYYYYTQAHSGTIDGTVAFSGTNKPSKAWELSSFIEGGVTYKTGTLLGEGSVNVDCTNGLKKDITLSCSYTFNGTADSYTPTKGTSRTVSVTATLSAIPRQATLLTAPNFTDSDNPIITYSNPSGNAVTSLEVAIYNDSGTQSYIPYREVSKTSTSYTFNLTEAERNSLRNATQSSNSLSVRFYIRTVIGDNTYLSFLARTFSVGEANPIITASVVDTNEKTVALTGDSGKLIKYYSNAQATMSAEAQKGAAIDEDFYIIRNGNNTGYGTSHTFENVEINEFTFSAEDSRGNVGTATIKPSMVSYTKLTCNIANNRPDALGNMSVACTGNYFNGSFGAVNNTLTVQYRYGIYGGSFSAWTNMSVTKNGNSYYASADFVIPNFNQQLFYSFETRAIDKLETISSKQSAVKSIPMFHWGENDFVFEVPVTFNKGFTNEEDDGEIPNTENGSWTPYLNSSAISSYITRYGCYTRMGNVITLGFYIKASCNSGYQNTSISISGLPYCPLLPTAGGGMCAGAYISGGKTFQCFVAETNCTITVRVQDCNNTSAANISTSASGCFYRNSGGEITLSGTITYMGEIV